MQNYFQKNILIKNNQNIIIIEVKQKNLKNMQHFPQFYQFLFFNGLVFSSSGTTNLNRQNISENDCFDKEFIFLKKLNYLEDISQKIRTEISYTRDKIKI